MEPRRFAFEELDVHRVALELIAVVHRITAELPRGYGDLRDHMQRSARSVHLNIAEGAGNEKPGRKAARYETARASANECASCIAEARMFGLAPQNLLSRASDLLHRLVAMLTRLIARWS